MPAAPYFDLVLTPNRSLRKVHARWIVAGVAAIMAATGLRAWLLGAWPVLPFLAIDLALLVWAFRASYRSGTSVELVRLDEDDLTIRRRSPAGQERRFRLEPFWTRTELELLSMDQNRLWLTEKRRRIAVGRFLSPGERVEIHRVIADGLRRFRDRG